MTGDGARTEVSVMGSTLIDGECVTPGQRALVAVLALHAEFGAGIDVLADGVWGWHPPTSARSSLQNQITRLRRSFGSNLIVCRHGLYHLHARTDRDRFVELAMPWISAPPSAAMIAPLSTALSLWRGRPFHDVTDHEPADVERARLEELKGTAVEQLALARITAGQPGAAIADLAIAAESDPYRERIWELLLVTLHLTGRRSEALDARGRYIDRLRAGLCAEPSPSFVRLGALIEQGAVIDIDEYLERPACDETASSRFAPCDHWARPSIRRSPCGRIRDAS